MSAAAAPASTREALAMLESAMGYLAAADPAQMAAGTQAQCLVALERLDAVETVTRAWILGAFTSGQGYSADADYSPRAWLIHKTRVTKGAAAGYLGWARRVTAHPEVAAALAEGTVLSESMARTVCGWTDRLAEGCRPAADAILVAAVRAGADQRALAELAAEIYARSLPDGEPEDGFDDRAVRVETTFDGAGVIRGDLTPECAALVTTVLDALSGPAGAEDTRTRQQRYHDGLQEAMRRLVASGLLPERAGQPVKAWVHVSLAELRALDTGSILRASGSPRSALGGPRTGPPRRWTAATAPGGWTATPLAPWLATPWPSP